MRSCVICTRLARSTISRSSTSEDTEKLDDEIRAFSESVAVHNMQVPVGPPEPPLDPSSFPVGGMMLRILAGMVSWWDEMSGWRFHRSADSIFPDRAAPREPDASLDAANGKLRGLEEAFDWGF